MQTPRLLPAIAVIALCATTFSTRADDTPAQAAARAALMQDMNDTGNADTSTPPPQPPPPVMTPPTPPPAPVVPPPPVATPAPAATVPQGASSNLVVPPVEQESALTNQTAQYPVNPPPVNPPMTQPGTPSTSTPPPMSGAGTDQPMTAPAVPVSEGQRQQLQALLQQYEANQITPAQYQAARAKILAGQ